MHRRSTILVVDDDPSILKSLKRLFIDDSISMLVAANARQALSLRENNAVDLVLSDEKMHAFLGAPPIPRVQELMPIFPIETQEHPSFWIRVLANKGVLSKESVSPFPPNPNLSLDLLDRK